MRRLPDSRQPDLAVVTPWYPLPYNPMAGSFVAAHARLAARLVDHVEVVHGVEWPGGTPEVVEGLRADWGALLDHCRAHDRMWVPGEVGPITRVPVMITGGMTVPERADAMVVALGRGRAPIEAPVVHGHVGYLGGLAAVNLAGKGSRLFVTEHSSGLRDVLADPMGRDQYARVLEAAERLFCVSDVLRRQVVEAFPQHEAKVEVLHNPVDFAAIPCRTGTPSRLGGWVFVGSLTENKGVERLVRAFCAVARSDDLHLTMYGDGPLRPRLEELAVEAGVRDCLDLRGVVPHHALLQELQTYDLLLAPSRYETFHLAVPEAVAAGLPVIVTRSGGPQEALAGVEDQVGVFVDMSDDPSELVDAYRTLSSRLGSLDLAAAKATLDARYGPDAVTSRLAAAYGPLPRNRHTRPSSPSARERVVVLAASANRRYSVKTDLAALAAAGTPTVVVTKDAELSEAATAMGAEVVPPYVVMRLPTAPPPPPLATRLKVLLRRRPATQPQPDPLGLQGIGRATLLVTDCHSAPHALKALARHPKVELRFELPRSEPPDGRA